MGLQRFWMVFMFAYGSHCLDEKQLRLKLNGQLQQGSKLHCCQARIDIGWKTLELTRKPEDTLATLSNYPL